MLVEFIQIPEKYIGTFNPLSANPTKRSNALKESVGKNRQIFSVCLTILWG